MGLVVFLYVFILYTVSVECGDRCSDAAKLMSEIYDCFPKEFINFEASSLLSNISDTIDRLDEDDGYKIFEVDYKALEAGCKKTSIDNIVSCYTSIMQSCNFTGLSSSIDDMKSSFQSLCDNAQYLREQECCLQSSYVYQTPCVRTEMSKLRSSIRAELSAEELARASCGLSTCMTSCRTQAVQLAKCDSKLVNVVSEIFPPSSTTCAAVPANTTFDCAKAKFRDDVSVTCSASVMSLSSLVAIIIVLFTLLCLV